MYQVIIINNTIYNFNIPQYDNSSTIGVTIEPGQRVRAAHNRADHDITGNIKDC
jgi:hypothetical protein